MTSFENFLIDKGYIQFILNCKTMRFEKSKRFIISTSENLDHRYFHNTDKNILDKIYLEKSVMDKDFTWEDRKGEICFGLHECNKPPTLISPRPRIKIIQLENDRKIIKDEKSDDSMNIVLQNIDYELIFKAMFDHSICISIDLT